MDLSKPDLELLQQATLELHEPRDLDGLRQLAPLVFKRVIPADHFFWLEFAIGPGQAPSGPVTNWQHPVRATAAMIEKAMSLAPAHPFTEHVLRTGVPAAMRLSDFWTRRQQVASAIHREVYRHLGIGWMLAIPMVRADRAGTLNLARPFDDPDFSERDRTLLGLLAPHFVQALGAAERVSASRDAEKHALVGLGLTPRERDVAAWLARGSTNSEIAAALSASPRTVEKHVERVLLKLGVENRTAAAQLVLGLGTVEHLQKQTRRTQARAALRRLLRPSKSARRG